MTKGCLPTLHCTHTASYLIALATMDRRLRSIPRLLSRVLLHCQIVCGGLHNTEAQRRPFYDAAGKLQLVGLHTNEINAQPSLATTTYPILTKRCSMAVGSWPDKADEVNRVEREYLSCGEQEWTQLMRKGQAARAYKRCFLLEMAVWAADLIWKFSICIYEEEVLCLLSVNHFSSMHPYT